MTDVRQEILLDLLTKRAIYGLDEAETSQLTGLSAELNYSIDDSFDLVAAAIGLSETDMDQQMPAHLNAKLSGLADSFFAKAEKVAEVVSSPVADPVVNQVVSQTEDLQPTFEFEPKRSSWSWLGWAVASLACVALAVNVYFTRFQQPVTVAVGPTPTVAPGKPDPSKLFDELTASSNIVKASLGAVPNAPADLKGVAGDVIWSDEKQIGYIKLHNLPQNDKAKATYQIWIFEENQGVKTPIDGGTFDVDSNGDVIIPITAKLKTKNPAMFAITVEKPGGVVVSDRKNIAALGKVAT